MAELIKKKGWVESKYLKEPRERVMFYRCSIAFMFALYVMPQYFGIANPIFDLTIVRMFIIFLLIFIVFDYDRSNDFVDLIKKERLTKVLIPYFAVISYTMVLRVDINAFLNPFIEFLELYLMIYIIRDSLGVEKTVKLVIGFIYLLVILGFVEAIMQESPFAMLVTIKGIYTGRYIRGGNYRIMSNCAHSLGYGLLLVTAMPFAGYDVKDNSFNIFRRPLLLFGIAANIFLTGSRSSLGVMGVELFLMFVFSDRKNLKNNIIIAVSSVIGFAALLFCIQGTSLGKYILLQFTSLIDTLFNTSYSVKYGADLNLLKSSSAYRDQLKGIYKLDWLNPILGIGRKRGFSSVVNGHVIKSIDNFYIAEYVRYAYPGEFAFIFFIFYYGYRMLKDIYTTRSGLIRALFVGGFAYCYHLKIADTLQTLKYLYVLLALYICCDKTAFIPENEDCRYIGKRVSKYVKK